MKTNNHKMHLEFDALSVNESFARVTVAAFATRIDPTLEEISDIKTAVSEAVTNSIIHGYGEEEGTVVIDCEVEFGEEEKYIEIIISDKGKGIVDIAKAREPMYTTKPECERSGMGFTFMEMFMDELHVTSQVGEGTIITMKKVIGKVQ